MVEESISYEAVDASSGDDKVTVEQAVEAPKKDKQALPVTVEERERIAKECLPEDVYAYIKEELGGSFIDVIPMKKRKLY